jgi:hypothetical protein
MRRQKILGFSALAAFAFLLGHSIAGAQAPGAPQPPDANAGLTRQVNLSPQEQVQQAEAMLARMDNSRQVVRRQLEAARAQRDVVKTLCLNDKLNQIDVAIRSARERKQSLDAAAARMDADLSNHEYTIMNVLRQRCDQLLAEANQCIGQEAAFVGESAVTSSVDTNLPSDSPWQSPNTNVIIDPPTCSSCVK